MGGNRKPRERLLCAEGSEHARDAEPGKAAASLHGSGAAPGRRTLAEPWPTGCSTAESVAFFRHAVTLGRVDLSRLARAISSADHAAALQASASLKQNLQAARGHVANGLTHHEELQRELADFAERAEDLLAKAPIMSNQAMRAGRDGSWQPWNQEAAAWRAQRENERAADGLVRDDSEPRIAPSGPPSELPFRFTIEAIFGTPLDSVRAYLGQHAALARHNAHAAAWHDSVAFAGQPTLSLVAHEIAHVLQRRSAIPGQTFSQAGDASEREADLVAHAVARGANRVSVHATRTAAISFSPDPGPAQMNAPVTLVTVVRETIDRAQRDQRRFGDVFGTIPGLSATLARVQGGHTTAIHDALMAGAAQIGGFTANIETKGQRAPALVTLDDLLTLLGDVFQNRELQAYGLPMSFGARVALDPLIDEVGAAFDDALRTTAIVGDPRAIQATIAAIISGHRAMIEAAIEQIAGAWDDPMDLVDLELEGGISKLVALRGELANAKTAPDQAAIGGQIAHLARYVLLLSDRLGDPKQRIQRKAHPGPAASLATMRGAAATLSASAALIGSEQQTLEGLGNSPELIGERRVTAVDPATAAPVSDTVLPEEAFAHHTDQLMARSQQEIEWQSRRQERELARQKAVLAPRGVTSYTQFVPVYARWFGFFSRAEREDQDGAFMQLYLQATNLMPMAGMSGHAARIGTQLAVSTGFASSGASDDFVREPSAIPLTRTTEVVGKATRNGTTDVTYRFQEDAGGHEDGDETSSRDRAIDEKRVQRRAAMDQVYAARPGSARDAAVVQGGLAPGPAPGEPNPPLWLYADEDYHEGRDGAKAGWNYLLIATIGHATGRLEQVYEHKVMRDEVARYLVAMSQHLQTLTQRHEIKDGKRANASRLGDAAGRSGDVMSSRANASAIYGDPADRKASEDASATRAAFAAEKHRALDGGGRDRAMATATRDVRTSIEHAMDEFFSTADGGEKLKAIILDIAVKEHGLDAAIWRHIEPEALWEFAKQAIEMAAIFWALERLGPVGQVASELFQRAMYRQDQRQFLSAAMAFAAWLDGATSARSFREAQGWAFTFVPIADGFAQTLRDWVAQKLGHGIAKQIGDAYTAVRSEPRTVGELRKQLAPILADAKVRHHVTQQLEAELHTRLKAGKALTADVQKLLAILCAVDPAVHDRLAGKFQDVPKLTEASLLADDPTLSAHTPLHLVAVQAEVRRHIDEHLEHAQTIQPYRVEVLTPAEFAKRFQSQKGRSMVTAVEDGRAVVYARPDARPRDVADEAIHLAQLNDPRSAKLAEHIRTLSAVTLGQWQTFDVELRKQLFERKLAVEIDAKQRRLAELRPGDPDWRPIHDELTNLQALEARSKAITDDQLLAMKAGGTRPAFLDDPAWLFAKETTTTVGVDLNEAGADLTKLATRIVTDSPATSFGTVKQVGEPWTQVTVILATNGGKVKLEGHAIRVDGRRYVFEDGAELHVKTGAEVQSGQLLATEPAKRYRLVNVEKPNGTVDQRLEIYSRKRGDRWVQAGEHSTRRGARVAQAARNQLHDELAAEKAAATDPHNPTSKDPDRLVEFVRVDNQTPQGGGFDDVLIEFRGDPPTALIRIIEVKDYPNRNVAMGEMTAIRENRRANLDRLREEIVKAGRVRTPGERSAPFRNLTDEQLNALRIAERTNNFRVELRLGPSTRIGDEAHSSTTILAKLRAELKASLDFGGLDVLDKAPPKPVDQNAIDAISD